MHHLAIFFVIPENFYRDLFITHKFCLVVERSLVFSTNGIYIYFLYIELCGFRVNLSVMVVFSFFEDYKKKVVVISLTMYEPYLFL